MAESLAMLPWYPGDFMRSTRGWTVTAKGVYRELLDAQWDLGALPADPGELRNLIGATPAEWALGWRKCEDKFPVGDDGQRRNEVLEAHRGKSLKLVERRSAGAKATNAKRHAQRADSDAPSERSASAERDAQRSHPSPSPSPSPDSLRSSSPQSYSSSPSDTRQTTKNGRVQELDRERPERIAARRAAGAEGLDPEVRSVVAPVIAALTGKAAQ